MKVISVITHLHVTWLMLHYTYFEYGINLKDMTRREDDRKNDILTQCCTKKG